MFLVRFFLNQRLFINILSVIIILLGYISLTDLNRERFPSVDLDIVLVTAVYPGASPDEIASLITTPVEDALKSADGIEEITSYSIDDRASIVVEIDPDLSPALRRQSIDEIRRLVDGVRDFPSDMTRPAVTELTSRKQTVGTVVVSSATADYAELRTTARALSDELKVLPNVAEVTRNGYLNREFRVELDPARMRAARIGADQVLNEIGLRNSTLPAGKLTSEGREVIIKTPSRTETVRDIERIVVQANDEGNFVRLGQIARVVDGFEEALTTTRVNGSPAISLTVMKKSSGDTIEVVDRVRGLLDEFAAKLPEGRFEFQIINNQADRVSTRINVLTNNALIGIILLLGTLFVFLNWRIALITAVGIPLAFAVTFILMNWLGYTLDMITLLGLIVVVGMVVDDAIIVAENVYRYIEAGETPYDAALKGTSEVMLPVAATILTTIAAFTPLLIMSGVRGKFAFFIAIVVILALLSSWLEAVFALPSHVADFAKPEDPNQRGKLRVWIDERFSRMRDGYESLLHFALRKRGYLLGTMAVLFVVAMSMIVTRILPFVPFPQEGVDTFIVACKAPRGTSLAGTEQRMLAVEEVIRREIKPVTDPDNPGRDEELLSYRTSLGVIQDRPGSRWSRYGSNYSVLFANLTEHSQRDRSGEDIIAALRPPAEAVFAREELDCQIRENLVGAARSDAIELTISGSDPDQLEAIKDAVYAAVDRPDLMKSFEISDDAEDRKPVLRIEAAPERLATLGLDTRILNSSLRTAFEGSEAASLRLGGEEVKIRVIFPEELRNKQESLEQVYLTNRNGMLVPLSAITKATTGQSPAAINHRDWKRTLTITIDPNDKNADVGLLVSEMRGLVEPVMEKFPGYQLNYAGSYKEDSETQSELVRSFYIAVLFIFLILITLFKSVFQPLIVMSAIPLGIIGTVITLMAHGKPLSFMGGIGFIGLIGVVVNDSLVMVEFINKELNTIWPVFRKRFAEAFGDKDKFRALLAEWNARSRERVVAGARLRFRPVLLTTVTTFFGLVPTAYGIGGEDMYVKPLALVFAWGLIIATVNTLFVIPAIYLSYLPLSFRIEYWWSRLMGDSARGG